jgi:hypothetical protein
MQLILSGARWNKFEALPHRIFPPKLRMHQEKKLISIFILQKNVQEGSVFIISLDFR